MYMCIYIYIFIYRHLFIHTYIHTCMHTYIHTVNNLILVPDVVELLIPTSCEAQWVPMGTVSDAPLFAFLDGLSQ